MWRSFISLLSALAVPTAHAGSIKSPLVPYSGAPFALHSGVRGMPATVEDMGNVEMIIQHLNQIPRNSKKSGNAHLCDMGEQADKKKCLDVDTGCMWTRVETQDPLKKIQASNQYCLPCEMDEVELPCWNVGAWVGGKMVTHCEMSCTHQQRILQPNYACIDDTGFVSQTQCFSKGAQSKSKCMFIAYEDKNGDMRASCAPCQLQGTGGWGCPVVGNEGPLPGTKVTSCLSQCDVLCAGPPACPPTIAPPPPPPPPSPGVVTGDTPDTQMISAPANIAAPTINPYTIVMGAVAAAKKAGFTAGTTPAPKVYWPVIYYNSPGYYMFTTGPPPNDGPQPPLPEGLGPETVAPGTSVHTVPEDGASLVEVSETKRTAKASLLRKLRGRNTGA